MSPTDLEEILQEEPSRPLRVTLSSGDQIIIEDPRHTLVAGMSLAVRARDDHSERVTHRMRLISIPNIALIEPFTGRQNGGRRRRR
jgi:hypothetical protein